MGGDEGIELAKADLARDGYSLYSQVWDDQPPLYTVVLKTALGHISHSILVARLVTVGFACLLLVSLFGIVRRTNGLVAAVLATGLLIASPGFLTLSCSCMQEIPALAPTLAALWLLLMGYQKSWRVPELAAGILFGVAMEIKIISAVLMPLAALIIWVCVRGEASRWRNFIAGVSIVALTALASTVATDLLCSGGSYLAHFQQSWRAHFGPTRSLECGSPRDRPFQWIVLLRNWDTTIPALVGIMFAIRASRTNRLLVLPAAWLLLNLGVFGSGAE